MLPNLPIQTHDFFFVRTDGRYQKINFCDIQYIEGCRNYVRIVTRPATYITLATMRQMEKLLSPLFCRVHRSYIVSLDSITAFDNDSVWLPGDKKIPLGDLYKRTLKERVTIVSTEACST